MLDYADNIAKEHFGTQTISKETTISIEIPAIWLGFALIVAFLIYVFGYQNSTIEQVKHNINIKKTKLVELRLQMDTLKMKQARIFNSNSIIADCEAKKMTVAKNIQIVY